MEEKNGFRKEIETNYLESKEDILLASLNDSIIIYVVGAKKSAMTYFLRGGKYQNKEDYDKISDLFNRDYVGERSYWGIATDIEDFEKYSIVYDDFEDSIIDFVENSSKVDKELAEQIRAYYTRRNYNQEVPMKDLDEYLSFLDRLASTQEMYRVGNIYANYLKIDPIEKTIEADDEIINMPVYKMRKKRL